MSQWVPVPTHEGWWWEEVTEETRDGDTFVCLSPCSIYFQESGRGAPRYTATFDDGDSIDNIHYVQREVLVKRKKNVRWHPCPFPPGHRKSSIETLAALRQSHPDLVERAERGDLGDA